MPNGFYDFTSTGRHFNFTAVAANEPAVFTPVQVNENARKTIAAKAGIESDPGIEWFWSLCDIERIPPSLASLAARALDHQVPSMSFCRRLAGFQSAGIAA